MSFSSSALARSIGLAALVVALYVTPLAADKIGWRVTAQWLLAEDGLYESLGALACLAAGVTFLLAFVWCTRSASHDAPPVRRPILLIAALVMLFVAGEELSWGQRLLNFSTPTAWRQINRQEEFNLHNLIVFQPTAKGNRLQVAMMACGVVYFFALPLLCRIFSPLKRLAVRHGAPLPDGPITVAMAISLALLVTWNGRAERLGDSAFVMRCAEEAFETSVEGLLFALALSTYAALSVGQPAGASRRRSLALALGATLLPVMIGMGWRAAGAIEHQRALLQLERFVHKADNLRLAGHSEMAIECYREAIKLMPEQALPRYNLANIYLELGQFEMAADALRSAIRCQPTLAEAHNNLGIALARQHKMHEAAACFAKALRLKPDYVEAQHNLDQIHCAAP